METNLPNLPEQLSQVVRDAIRDELREQTRNQRHAARMYAGAGAAGLYGGAALTAFLLLVLGLALPYWLAALIVAVLLLGAAVLLSRSARGSRGAPPDRPASLMEPGVPPGAPVVPPVPPVAPEAPHSPLGAPRDGGR
ncbi:phage holin family protein [Streptomyces sp. NPDC048361]|uniref:phage holin family protein n=1 Tax=Streptomyces sp. NPDC048361 TaxID=3154720 RepID=UPI003428C2E5